MIKKNNQINTYFKLCPLSLKIIRCFKSGISLQSIAPKPFCVDVRLEIKFVKILNEKIHQNRLYKTLPVIV